MGKITPPQQDGHAGRRLHSRLRLALPARMVTLDGTFHGILIDLSLKGAKIRLGCDLRPGSNAELTWGPFGTFCTIQWAREGLCGLKFDDPLSPQVLIVTRDLEDANPQVDARREAARQFVRGSIRL